MDVLLKDICDVLAANVTALNMVDLDEGQLDIPERENPILCPAVYVDAINIDWRDRNFGLQTGFTTIRLRIAFDIYENTNSLAPEDRRVSGFGALALLKQIHAVLNNHSGTTYNCLERVNTAREDRQDLLKVYTMDYVTELTDNSGLIETTPQIVNEAVITPTIE